MKFESGMDVNPNNEIEAAHTSLFAELNKYDSLAIAFIQNSSLRGNQREEKSQSIRENFKAFSTDPRWEQLNNLIAQLDSGTLKNGWVMNYQTLIWRRDKFNARFNFLIQNQDTESKQPSLSSSENLFDVASSSSAESSSSSTSSFSLLDSQLYKP